MKYACIHGHFYQPPRENPWTGEIERQPSAGEDHDWNARIARECYRPNGEAKILGEDGALARTVNNYSWMSFNFGPTLLNWMETHETETYRRILEADKESRKRLNGHGNAIAQAYNHMILPLANDRDRETQIRWGIGDFISRFGRVPEALWLSECAVNDEVMSLLARHRFKYVILGPEQAAAVISPKGERREVLPETLDVRRPYSWKSPDGSGSVAVFFYDLPLSRDAAFSQLMASAPGAAERFVQAFGAADEGLVSLASDGETYGHHQKFADMGLAYLLTEAFGAQGVSVVNYGWYLSRHKPKWRVELASGGKGLGTSWSCPHGVLRWTEDCGCGSDGKPMAWKKPLREAFDFLRDRLAPAYERAAGEIFKDPWEARNDYISVLRDDGEASARDFLSRHLHKRSLAADPEAKGRALLLLEMQKYALFMYTSCGWFFPEITGLEASQNIKYARRALELAQKACGLDLEAEFAPRLQEAFDAARPNPPEEAGPEAGAVPPADNG